MMASQKPKAEQEAEALMQVFVLAMPALRDLLTQIQSAAPEIRRRRLVTKLGGRSRVVRR